MYMSIWLTISLAILGFIGFWIADHVLRMKRGVAPATCPFGQDCGGVIHGRYSSFLGVPVAQMGRAYYLAVSAFFLLSSIVALPRIYLFIAMIVTGVGLLFSLYLVSIQLFVLKKWCTWCLFSALTTILIFIVSFIGFSEQFIGFLFNYRDLLDWLFIASSLVGALVSTLYALKFVRFLRDFHISKKEYYRLQMYSHTAWFAIGFTFLSGLGLVLTDVYREVTGNSEFLVLGIIIGILVVYEFFQNTIVGPRLIDIHFGEHPQLDDEEHHYQRKVAFAFTSIGFFSWYLLLLFANLSWHEYQPLTLVAIYVGLIIASVVIGLVVERNIYRKSTTKLTEPSFPEGLEEGS